MYNTDMENKIDDLLEIFAGVSISQVIKDMELILSDEFSFLNTDDRTVYSIKDVDKEELSYYLLSLFAINTITQERSYFIGSNPKIDEIGFRFARNFLIKDSVIEEFNNVYSVKSLINLPLDIIKKRFEDYNKNFIMVLH